MTRVWSREAQEALIEVYKKHPCLYQVSSPHYYNREYNRNAVDEMVETVSQFYPDITSKECKKKYLVLRNQFSVQHRKLKESCSKSGSGADAICTPKLWCYNHLLFLADHLKSRQGDFVGGESSKQNVEPTNDDNDDDDSEACWPIETIDEDASIHSELYGAEFFSSEFELTEPVPSTTAGIKKKDVAQKIRKNESPMRQTSPAPVQESATPSREAKKRKWEEKDGNSLILSHLDELRKIRAAKEEKKLQKVPPPPKTLNVQFGEFLVAQMDQLDPDLNMSLRHCIMKKIMECELIMENRNKNK